MKTAIDFWEENCEVVDDSDMGGHFISKENFLAAMQSYQSENLPEQGLRELIEWINGLMVFTTDEFPKNEAERIDNAKVFGHNTALQSVKEKASVLLSGSTSTGGGWEK